MKVLKTIISLSLALFLITALVSCDGDSSNNNVADVESKEIFIPDFGLSSSKGMTHFPQKNPFMEMNVGNHPNIGGADNARIFLACNAMSSLPMLPSFEKYTENPKAFVEKYKKGNLKIYGFDARVKIGKVNEDGIYLFIIAYEEKKPICAFEYYYSWINKTFSYREIVAAFLNRQAQPNGDVVLLFEMYNVPVKEENGVISFTAGVKNGDFDTATQIKLYKLGLPTLKGVAGSQSSPLSFREFNVILKQDGNMLSAGLGYEKYQNQFVFIDQIPDTNRVHEFLLDASKQAKYGYTYVVDSVPETPNYAILDDDTCNIDFAYEYLSLFFNGFANLLDESSFTARTAGIVSMEKFNSLKYTFKDTTAEKLFRYNNYGQSGYNYYIKDIIFPVVYSIKNNKGTTSDMSAFDSGLFEGNANTGYIQAFNGLFGLNTDSMEAFKTAILQQCGLSEEKASDFTPNTSLH